MKRNKKNVIAVVGDVIEWIEPRHYLPLQGRVLFVYENSVGVEILNYSRQLRELFVNDRTVVNHKKYFIVAV